MEQQVVEQSRVEAEHKLRQRSQYSSSPKTDAIQMVTTQPEAKLEPIVVEQQEDLLERRRKEQEAISLQLKLQADLEMQAKLKQQKELEQIK